jgi:signal transduction histidine kinase
VAPSTRPTNAPPAPGNGDLGQTIVDLRPAIFSLQGADVAPGGLPGRLLDPTTDAAPAPGFEPRLQFDGPFETIGDDIAEQLLPTLRGTLSNIAHHARARSARFAISGDRRSRAHRHP